MENVLSDVSPCTLNGGEDLSSSTRETQFHPRPRVANVYEIPWGAIGLLGLNGYGDDVRKWGLYGLEGWAAARKPVHAYL